MKRVLIIAAAMAILAGCDAGPKAGAGKPSTPTAAQSSGSGYAPASQAAPERRSAPVRLVAGKPLWSSNRQMSAEENARSHFERDGAAFDSKTEDDFVAKAHAFTAHPPKGAQRLERPNGDVLLYDAKTNTFAVMSREGAPRTMFKPRNGADYWDTQVRKEKAKSGRD